MFILSTNAQSTADALNFSQTFNGGTARFVSMGGAFGALGGDFSSLSYNPAGIGVYRSSEFSITPSFKKRNISSDYNSSNSKDSRNRFGFDNIGFVLSYKPGKDSEKGLINLNVAFGYNVRNDFNSNSFAKGNNSSNSIMDYFANSPGSIDESWLTIPSNPSDSYNPYSELGSQYWPAILAYNTFLIDPVTGGGYIRALNNGDGVLQRNYTETNGSSGDYLFSIGANISNKLFLGASFTVQNLNYSYSSTYYEDAFESNDTIDIGGGFGDRFNALDYFQDIETIGNGYNLKIGGIYKPMDGLRIGLAFHTPTYFKLQDTYSYSVNSYMRSATYKESSPNGRYDYQLETPLKVIVSLAYTFKDFGLLSIDIEHVNFSSMRFRNTDDASAFTGVNDNIKSSFRNINNIKLGGEIKIKDIYLRGGYAFYPSPYKKDYLNNNSNRSIISGGLGYRSGNLFIDAAYLYSMQNEKSVFYDLRNLDGTSAVNPVNSKIIEGKFLLTVGFKF